MFQLAGRIVTDAGHEADLMIDEDERCVLRSEGLVGTGLIGHGILLGFLRLLNGLGQFGLGRNVNSVQPPHPYSAIEFKGFTEFFLAIHAVDSLSLTLG